MRTIKLMELPKEIKDWLESDKDANYPTQDLLRYGLEEGYIKAYYYNEEYYFISLLSNYKGELWDDILKRLCTIAYGKVDFQFDCLKGEIMDVQEVQGWFVALTILKVTEDGTILKA
ncbi:hypothetical protein ABE039_20765 [Priestia megaterium]